MPTEEKSKAPSAIALAIGLIALLTAFSAKSRNAGKYGTEPSADTNKTADASAERPISIPGNHEQPGNGDACRKDANKPQVDYFVRITSAITLIVSIVYAVFAGLQWCSMRGQQTAMEKQLKEMIATRKDTETQFMAQIVYVDPVMFPMNAQGAQVAKDSRDIVGWSVSPGWKNTGSTAAVDFTYETDVSIKPRDRSKEIHEIYKSCPDRPNLSYPGIRVSASDGGTALGKNLSLNDAEGAQRGLLAVFLVFNATYRDIFEKPSDPLHHYFVCVLIEVHDAMRSEFSFLQVFRQVD